MTSINPADGSPSYSKRTLGLIFLFLSILWAFNATGRFLPNLLRQDRYDDDASQHVWWTYKFADPTLYPNDEMRRFMSGPPFAPLGYRAVYWLGNHVMDAQRFSETLPFFISAGFVIVAFAIGRQAGGGVAAGVIIASLACGRFYFDHFQGGFPRSFGLLAMSLAMWALLARRFGWLGFAFLATAIFYPPCLVPPSVCTAVVLGLDVFRTRKLPKGWLLLVILGVVSIALLVSYVKGLPPEFGPTVTLAEAHTLPEFGPNGRAGFFGLGWKTFFFDSPLSGFGSPMQDVLIFAGLVIVSLIVFGNFLPAEAWVLLISSLVSFGLAHLTLFRLFVPNRHVQYPLVVFRLIWIAALARPVLAWVLGSSESQCETAKRPPTANGGAAISRFAQNIRHFCVVRAPVPILMVVAIGILIGAGSSTARHLSKEFKLPVDHDMENALAFIKTLPKDTVISAHPYDADAIPLRTQHSIVACWETYHPYWDGYYRYIQPRVAAEIKATYASDWADVAPMHDLYHADVFLVNGDRYWDNNSIWFCRPYTADDVAAVEIGRQKGFALLNAPADRVLYRSGRMAVVRLSP